MLLSTKPHLWKSTNLDTDAMAAMETVVAVVAMVEAMVEATVADVVTKGVVATKDVDVVTPITVAINIITKCVTITNTTCVTNTDTTSTTTTTTPVVTHIAITHVAVVIADVDVVVTVEAVAVARRMWSPLWKTNLLQIPTLKMMLYGLLVAKASSFHRAGWRLNLD